MLKSFLCLAAGILSLSMPVSAQETWFAERLFDGGQTLTFRFDDSVSAGLSDRAIRSCPLSRIGFDQATVGQAELYQCPDDDSELEECVQLASLLSDNPTGVTVVSAWPIFKVNVTVPETSGISRLFVHCVYGQVAAAQSGGRGLGTPENLLLCDNASVCPETDLFTPETPLYETYNLLATTGCPENVSVAIVGSNASLGPQFTIIPALSIGAIDSATVPATTHQFVQAIVTNGGPCTDLEVGVTKWLP